MQAATQFLTTDIAKFPRKLCLDTSSEYIDRRLSWFTDECVTVTHIVCEKKSQMLFDETIHLKQAYGRAMIARELSTLWENTHDKQKDFLETHNR